MEDTDVAARLFVTAPLVEGGVVPLDADQVHYLRSVLRLAAGGKVALFNGRDGEWLGAIDGFSKHAGTVRLVCETRHQHAEIDIWLLFAPVKRTRIDLIAEKATELGATRLMPVFTRRTIVSRVNTDRLRANAREAAEQTERLSIPIVAEPQSLEQALADFPAGRRLLLCDETGGAPPIATLLLASGTAATQWAILVGPEGGFAPDELDALKNLPFVTPVGLGPRVLRADTAALAALAVFQALAGDWNAGHRRR
jgi:16S rRNA (uracil1498-N3)-methyltransferase